MKKITKIAENKQSANEQKKLRVAAYCRVSTDSDAQLESLEAQKTHYENYINSRKAWGFAGLYYDEGITGIKKHKRKELLRLITDCESGLIDFVITKSISRFARNTTDCLELVRKLLELDIPIYFEKENINTGSMESELFLTILSSMAESESVSISQNAKWSFQKRFANGTYKVGYPPYGYSWNGKEMVIVPEEAVIVQRMYNDALSGKGTSTIAAELNKEQVPAKCGNHWSASTVRGILANEKYIGDAMFQKTYSDGSFNRHTNNGQMTKYYMTEHHEPIISKEVFEAVAAVITQRSNEKGVEKGNKKYQQRYSFSGKIICCECGNTFKRRTHTCTGNKYIAWCCNTHLSDNDSCSMQYIRDDDIKLAFITMMNKLIYSHQFILKPLLKNLKQLKDDENSKRIKDIQNLLMRNAEQRETLSKLMAQGYIDNVLYNKESNALLMQADNYRSKLTMLTHSLTDNATLINETTELLRFAEKANMLNSFDEKIFDRFVSCIKVYSRNEIGFELKCGLTLKERI